MQSRNVQSSGDAVNEDPNAAEESPPEGGVVCDFCGREAPSVRRIALDGEYERLRTRHQVQYACPNCSADKERARGSDE